MPNESITNKELMEQILKPSPDIINPPEKLEGEPLISTASGGIGKPVNDLTPSGSILFGYVWSDIKYGDKYALCQYTGGIYINPIQSFMEEVFG